ncbi:hypothetical protein MJG53_009960 [Ovis ammon polii x Ovis aries]|uniref:Uncharacterized protein n=1 Tax=Ovis ammon polii x Ovis aries TaxID=2918886 RepID=A0ACB9UVI5_9CETA|nr:hypothetical protein MJG53_009960 [Ovis ammon polii x Ovis aries]
MSSSMPSVMIKEKLIFKFVSTFVENTIVPVKTVLGENRMANRYRTEQLFFNVTTKDHQSLREKKTEGRKTTLQEGKSLKIISLSSSLTPTEGTELICADETLNSFSLPCLCQPEFKSLHMLDSHNTMHLFFTLITANIQLFLYHIQCQAQCWYISMLINLSNYYLSMNWLMPTSPPSGSNGCTRWAINCTGFPPLAPSRGYSLAVLRRLLVAAASLLQRMGSRAGILYISRTYESNFDNQSTKANLIKLKINILL